MIWREILARPLWGGDSYPQNPHNPQNSDCVRGFEDSEDFEDRCLALPGHRHQVQLELDLVAPASHRATATSGRMMVVDVLVGVGAGNSPCSVTLISTAATMAEARSIAHRKFGADRVLTVVEHHPLSTTTTKKRS